MANQEKPTPQGAAKNDTVQGEGDYDAARRYDQKAEKFVNEHKDDIEEMAEDASDALDSPEGDALREAEEREKSKARE